LTWVFSFLFFLFPPQFHPLTLDWLRIKHHDLFLFALYEVILVLWHTSRVLQVNPCLLGLFSCILFLDWIFFSISFFSNGLIENWTSWFILICFLWDYLISWSDSQVNLSWLQSFFDLLFMRLFRSYEQGYRFGELTRVDLSFFHSFFNFFFQFHPSTLGWLRIRLHNLFWFTFYEFIMVSRPKLWI